MRFTPISVVIAAQRHADRPQPREVWQAFRRLCLPPVDVDFIYACLWKRLSVGARLKAIWPSVSERCPFDSSVEDIHHCTKTCSWLTIPVRALQCAFPSLWTSSGRATIGRWCSNYPHLFLTRAPGVLMWKAVRVLWSCKCDVVFQKARLTVHDYIRVLHSEVLKWLAMPDLSLDHDAVRLYAGALRGWLTDRNIPMSEGSDVASHKRAGPALPQPDRYFRRQTFDGWGRREPEWPA